MSAFDNYTDVVRMAHPQTPAVEPRSEPSHGGVTRVIYGLTPPEVPLSRPEPTRVHGGTISHMAGANEVQSADVARHAVSFDGAAGGSVMATKQRQGMHDTVELIPGQPSTRTQIAVALREGLIRQMDGGGYADVVGAPAAMEHAAEAEAAEKEQGPADPGAEIFAAEDDAEWAAAIDPLPQHAYDAAAASVSLAVVTGADLASAAQALAVDSAIEPALARQYVEAGYAMHERAVAAAVAPLGLGEGSRKEAFYEFAREHPQKLQEAVQRLVHARDPGGFIGLAQQFRRVNPGGEVSALQQAGFETHVDTSGAVLVRRPGGDWVRASDLLK